MGMLAHGVFALKGKTRLLVAVLVFAALIGVAVWRGLDLISSEKKIEVSPSAESKSAASVLSALSEASKDSDQDGLKDWEETILRTDPNKADSDGDGTPDGEEIAQNRDPLKKGPNDTLSNPYPLAPNPSLDGNLTYALTKNLLESGVLSAIDQSGRITSTDFLDKLTLPSDINPDQLLKPAELITEKKLILGNSNDSQVVKEYFNALYGTYARYAAALQQKSDLAILVSAIQNSDYAKLAELDPIIQALERMIADIKKIPVPPDYKSVAIREINYLLKTKRAVEIFRNTQNDPLATALIIRPRLDLLTELASFHEDTKARLAAKGIVFNPGEGGVTYFP